MSYAGLPTSSPIGAARGRQMNVLLPCCPFLQKGATFDMGRCKISLFTRVSGNAGLPNYNCLTSRVINPVFHFKNPAPRVIRKGKTPKVLPYWHSGKSTGRTGLLVRPGAIYGLKSAEIGAIFHRFLSCALNTHNSLILGLRVKIAEDWSALRLFNIWAAFSPNKSSPDGIADEKTVNNMK